MFCLLVVDCLGFFKLCQKSAPDDAASGNDRDIRFAPCCCETISGKTGGSLGQIGPGQTVPEFEAALSRMADREIALIETRYGFHVIMVDRRIPGRELPFELVKDRIASWMEERVRRTAIRQYISILAGRATVTGIDLGVTQSPLVQ